MTEEVRQERQKEVKQQVMDSAVNHFLRSPRNGIFYQTEVMACMIPVQFKLGDRLCLLKMN